MRLLCKFIGTVGELTDALTTAEIAANTIPNAKIYFKVTDTHMAPLAKSAWFVKDVLPRDAGGDGFDAVVEMSSDRDYTHEVEIQHRRKIKSMIDEQLQQLSEKMHMPVDKMKKPGGYPILATDTPIWDRAMGYLITIADSHSQASVIGDLALTITGPTKPFLPNPKGVKEKTNKELHRLRNRVKPGVPYVVVGDAEDLINMRGIEFPVPDGWGIVPVDHFTPPELVVGLISNPRCKGVISMSGGVSRIAWAANVPMILEFVNGGEGAYWTSVRSGRSATVDLSHEETTNETIANTLRAMYRLSHKIEME